MEEKIIRSAINKESTARRIIDGKTLNSMYTTTISQCSVIVKDLVKVPHLVETEGIVEIQNYVEYFEEDPRSAISKKDKQLALKNFKGPVNTESTKLIKK